MSEDDDEEYFEDYVICSGCGDFKADCNCERTCGNCGEVFEDCGCEYSEDYDDEFYI